jgi:hypothetical protein
MVTSPSPRNVGGRNAGTVGRANCSDLHLTSDPNVRVEYYGLRAPVLAREVLSLRGPDTD